MAAMRHYRQRPDTPACYRHSEAISEPEVLAIRAVADGIADAYQQQLAMRTIIVKLALTYDQEYVIGSPDQSAFRGGRSFVGKQIMKLRTADLDKLLGDNNEDKT